MASKFNLSSIAASVLAQTMMQLLDHAVVDVFDGAQPADADTPLSAINHSLATFQLPAEAMNQLNAGVITIGPVDDTLWKMNAKASFARVSKDGRTIFDASVGVSNADIVINANPVVEGAVAHIVGGATYTVTR